MGYGHQRELALGEHKEAVACQWHKSALEPHCLHCEVAQLLDVLRCWSIVEIAVLVQYQVVAHNCGTQHRHVGNIGSYHLEFLVIENHKTKVGGYHGAIAAGKGDVVDRLRGHDVGILDVADVAHAAIASVYHVDVRVLIHHHDILLIVVVVDVLHSRVAKVVGTIEMLILLRVLVVTEQVVA